MGPVIIAVIVVGVILLLLVIWLFATYNGLVRLRNQTKNAWSQIDVQLKRRHDLIPNLVETVKGYAAHERQTLEAVTQARNIAQSAVGKGVGEQAKADHKGEWCSPKAMYRYGGWDADRTGWHCVSLAS